MSEFWKNCVIELLENSQYTLDIFIQDLDERVWYDKHCLALLKTIALSGRHAQIRILTPDTKTAAYGGHPVIELSQRLSSHILARNLRPQDNKPRPDQLISDHKNLLTRGLGHAESKLALNAAMQARKSLQAYNELWNAGSPDLNFRAL
ncbi:MAG: DUF7931 domain-containing protein [bacterium]